jgi:hypothetical protein
VLGFAGDHAVGKLQVFLRAERGVAAARHDPKAGIAVVAQELLLPRRLHAHAADADHVGARLERQRLDVFVDDAHLPVRRAQRGERGEAERRIERALAGEHPLERPAEAPEALRLRRIDEQ